jgi:hypothetical protein
VSVYPEDSGDFVVSRFLGHYDDKGEGFVMHVPSQFNGGGSLLRLVLTRIDPCPTCHRDRGVPLR